ncbi:MAG: ATP-grasp domain-containing protein [Desulfamplus sp.]|nr:ATP-grasp domain-containing protein [Desulfamplus sp.]
MTKQSKILVVGTTSDYIHLLGKKAPGELLFVTDYHIRRIAREPAPLEWEEILCDLRSSQGLREQHSGEPYSREQHSREPYSREPYSGEQHSGEQHSREQHSGEQYSKEPYPPENIPREEKVAELVLGHLKKYGMTLSGIVCFDCESMPLTAELALRLGLKGYPSPRVIQSCRDKSITRRIWQAQGIDTPEARCITSEREAGDFFLEKRVPCVLKPLDGSGSERVFRCTDTESCKDAYTAITSLQKGADVIIETWVEGTEYSCDVIIGPGMGDDPYSRDVITGSGTEDDPTAGPRAAIPIRFTRKIHSPLPFFGTTMAYELIDFPRGNISKKSFLALLGRAARALGITRGICMIDFIVTENGVSLLEMTPRPGGDCLPWLIQKGMKVDILKLALDMAGDPDIPFHAPTSFSPLVGLRIHAPRPGILKGVDTSAVMEDPRVREVLIRQEKGRTITLPPMDYDSWNLGHIIFKPSGLVSCESQCLALLSKLKIEMEPVDSGPGNSWKFGTRETGGQRGREVNPHGGNRDGIPAAAPEPIWRFVEKFFTKGEDILQELQRDQIPCYIFEPGIIKERARTFKAAFEEYLPDTGFYFAVKSNNHPGVSRAALESGFGLDVSSGEELEMALGMNAPDIVFSGPGKTPEELDRALLCSGNVTVLMDSFGELSRLEKRAALWGKSVTAGVRLNTDPEGVWKKFGIALGDLKDFMEAAQKSPNINLQGLQFHTSWNMGPERQVQFIKELGQTLKTLSREQRDMIRFLDIGGGYWPDQGEWLIRTMETGGKHFKVEINRAVPIHGFAREIGKAVESHIHSRIDCRICFEPGRWICNDAMHLLIQVVDKKYENLAITDAGTNAVGWERFEIDYFPILNLSRPQMTERECLILGSLCTPQDVWGYRYWGSSLKEGDILMIPTQGAYTYSLGQKFIKALPQVVTLT